MSAVQKKSNTSRAVKDPAHQCRFITSDGRHCANPHRDSASGYCLTHERLSQKQAAAQARALADELILDFNDFDDPAEVHLLLTRLFRMVAEDRISLRRAVVLLHIGRTLIRTLRQLEIYVSNERPEYPAINLTDCKRNTAADESDPDDITFSSSTDRQEDPPTDTSLDS